MARLARSQHEMGVCPVLLPMAIRMPRGVLVSLTPMMEYAGSATENRETAAYAEGGKGDMHPL